MHRAKSVCCGECGGSSYSEEIGKVINSTLLFNQVKGRAGDGLWMGECSHWDGVHD